MQHPRKEFRQLIARYQTSVERQRRGYELTLKQVEKSLWRMKISYALLKEPVPTSQVETRNSDSAEAVTRPPEAPDEHLSWFDAFMA